MAAKTPGTKIKPKANNATAIIRQQFSDKREALIRQGQVNAMIIQNVLGLDKDGDMKDFIRGATQNLKESKKT
ncbi:MULTISPECIES: hypothetical protein [unclassified Microcoleus]|uniref:hypothetical protein n=1 Tax=unclassified Microcoleus TaxID=2642155 RepID=UPI002FD0A88F